MQKESYAALTMITAYRTLKSGTGTDTAIPKLLALNSLDGSKSIGQVVYYGRT